MNCVQKWQAKEFDICKELDGEYPDWVSKYVDVTDETDTREDDDAGDLFERAGGNTEQFSSEADEFWETYDEYQTARENNNTAQARQKARELGQLASQTNETGTALERDFRLISNRTDANVTPALDDLDMVLENITSTAAAVDQETFEQTETTASIDQPAVSCANPATVSGFLTTENGTPIRNESVHLDIGDRRIATRTNASGGYSVEYCPVSLSPDTQQITVRFVPDTSSQYASSETQVSVRIEAMTPNITMRRSPASAGYNDTVTISGAVTATGDGIGSVPVTITLGGQQLTTVETDADGQYRTTVAIPATIPDGDRTLEAEVGAEGTALAPANATRQLTITPTGVNVSLSATRVTSEGMTVEGVVEPVEGPPVEGLTIRVALDEEPITRTSTTTSGSFRSRVEVPERVQPSPGENVSLVVVATFDAQGTNLEAARETVTVELAGPQVGDEPDTLPWRQWLGVAALALVVALILGGLRWTGRLPASDIAGGVSGRITGGISTLSTMALSHRPLSRVGPVISVVASGSRSLINSVRPILRPLFRLAALLALIPAMVGSVLGRTAEEPGQAEDAPTADESPEAAAEPSLDSPPEQAAPPSWDDQARAKIQAGHVEAAITLAYETLRNSLQDQAVTGQALTHWEFFTACLDADLPALDSETLRTIVETYEQAAFAPSPVSREQAHRMIELVHAVQSTHDRPSEPVADD